MKNNNSSERKNYYLSKKRPKPLQNDEKHHNFQDTSILYSNNPNPNFYKRYKLLIEYTYKCDKSDIIYIQSKNNNSLESALVVPHCSQNKIFIVPLIKEKGKIIGDRNKIKTIKGEGVQITYVKYLYNENNKKNYLMVGDRLKNYEADGYHYKIIDILTIYEIKSLDDINPLFVIKINDFVTSEIMINDKIFLSYFNKEHYYSKKRNYFIGCFDLNGNLINQIAKKSNIINKLLSFNNEELIVLSKKQIIFYNINIFKKAKKTIKILNECKNGCVVDHYLCVAEEKEIAIYDLLNKELFQLINNNFQYNNRYIGSIIPWGNNFVIFSDSHEDVVKVYDIRCKKVVCTYPGFSTIVFYKFFDNMHNENLLLVNGGREMYVWENSPSFIINIK